MQVSKLALFIAAIILLLGVYGCEREIVNHVDAEENADCFTCHGDDDFALIAAQKEYAASVHAMGETYNRNRLNSSRYSSCEQCHTNEGFVANVTGGEVAGDHFTNVSCFTCHAPHTTGSLGLRTTLAITLENDATYDKGNSNICANCHHSRADVTTYVVDSVELSERYGPHHSNQSDMLVGENAYEYADYSYDNSYHSSGVVNGCLTCHMASGIYNTGGHSFNMEGEDEGDEHFNVTGCNTELCHDGNMDDFNRTSSVDYDWDGEFEGVQDEIAGLLDSLGILLVNAGVYDTATGLPIEDVIVPDADTTGALFNLLYVKEDRSMGVHNTAYAVGLLRSSINYLDTGDPSGMAVGKLAYVIRNSH
ncbi:MAG: hypothetical protein ABIJ45_07875 [Candidatus Zixiibacteriota bacterium]